jgi:hypothetical protein
MILENEAVQSMYPKPLSKKELAHLKRIKKIDHTGVWVWVEEQRLWKLIKK